MCRLKKISSILLLVLLVGSCSLWAFPGRETQMLTVTVPSTAEEIRIPEVQVMPSAGNSEKEQENGLTTLSNLLEDYGETTRLNKDDIEELINQLVAIKADYELLLIDIEDKDNQIDDLSSLNSAQADDLAYLKGAYDKETSTKAYARVGGVLGFEKNVPSFGVGGAIGLRFGEGLLTEVGAQYMLGTVNNYIRPFALDNLSITASIGWEW